MRNWTLGGCILVLWAAAGCSHVPFMGEKTQPVPVEANAFVELGRIIDAQALKNGKGIAIVPFTAGVDVAATEEVDKAALMIIKGVSDVFGKAPGQFTVLTKENAETADFFIKGHVSDIQDFSKVGSWVLLKGQRSVSVEGKMINAQTGEAVLVFSDTQQTQENGEDHGRLGYLIGENVGHFILSGVQ